MQLKFMTLLFILVALALATACMTDKRFGSTPKDDRLERIKQQPNYQQGEFTNIEPTTTFAPGVKRRTVFKNMLFGIDKRATPKDSIPSVRENLQVIPADQDVLVWLGHSSAYMQVDGIRIMLDPVLSNYAAPYPLMVRAYKGTLPYTAADFPELDYLIITHDHWDHLDYATVRQLKFKKVICPLGVGQHFERWGFAPESIIEGNWGDTLQPQPEMEVHVCTTRHFSGRGIKRNQTVWVSYVLQTPHQRIYISGDGGYGQHFAQLGQQFGSFDLALIENGQYSRYWQQIHMLPEESMQAALDLGARRVLPTHNSKFRLALHAWDEPLQRISALAAAHDQISLLTPKIGQVVYLADTSQVFEHWWEGRQ